MKATFNLFAISVLLAMSSFAMYSDDTPLDGSWKLRDFNYGGNKGTNPKPGFVKIFENGKFGSYLLLRSGAEKRIDGTYKVLDENYYSETIVEAANKPMIGKTYKIKYQIIDSLLIMSGTFDSPEGQVSYSETWVKVDPKILASLGTKSSDSQ